MTAQEELHAVETAIRQALPRLMEPTEGCKIEYEGDVFKIISVLGSKKKEYLVLNQKTKRFTMLFSENEIKISKIIGHDILLSDVLEWLGTLFHFSIDHKGIIYKEFDYYFEGYLDRDYTEVARVDFSKPRLADQSVELINFLYNLIKED